MHCVQWCGIEFDLQILLDFCTVHIYSWFVNSTCDKKDMKDRELLGLELVI